MVRAERTIEVTVISATDLKKVKKFGREQKNYLSAYIYPARRQTTAADPYGGVNPIWNTTLKLTCYESDLHPAATSSGEPAASSSSAPSAHEMTLEIYSHGGGIFHTADKLVGTVTVPLQQVASAAKVGAAMPPFEVHLPTHCGEVQGTLNLSVKLGAKRELGEYEDLSAAPLPSYSDQGTAFFVYPPASDKVPSTQTGSYNSDGQSSYDVNHPATSGYPPSSSKQTSSHNSKGQPSYDGNYPPKSGYSPSSSDKVPSTQTSSYNSKGQSSYDGNYSPTSVYPPPSPNQNTRAAEDDVVTGFPVPGYAFDPLGQLPMHRQQQAGPETSGHGPYVVDGTRHQTRRERKHGRKHGRRGRRRAGGDGQQGRKHGLVGVGLLALQMFSAK